MDRDPTSLSDEELMSLVKQKDTDAYSEIVKRHTNRFYALSYRLLSERESAEDVVQDSFLMLWNSPGKWDPDKNAKFTTWFYRVVTNACLDQKRKIKSEISDEDIELQSQAKSQEEEVEIIRTKDRVDSLIKELPESQQTALALCFYEGVSNKEAAEVMDISVKALESLLMRAKTTLRQKFGDGPEGAARPGGG